MTAKKKKKVTVPKVKKPYDIVFKHGVDEFGHIVELHVNEKDEWSLLVADHNISGDVVDFDTVLEKFFEKIV
jgi:hypothetical protein